MSSLSEPYVIAILPDHATPIKIRTHSRDPVPFAIAGPSIKPDCVKTFDEFSAKKGGFGLVENDSLLSLLLSYK
jgi:2,3-bisphosphoglycerate-independent phosphoglycerate mutase